SSRPSTAKAIGVVASATSAAESARISKGSLASSSRYWDQRLVKLIVTLDHDSLMAAGSRSSVERGDAETPTGHQGPPCKGGRYHPIWRSRSVESRWTPIIAGQGSDRQRAGDPEDVFHHERMVPRPGGTQDHQTGPLPVAPTEVSASKWHR